MLLHFSRSMLCSIIQPLCTLFLASLHHNYICILIHGFLPHVTTFRSDMLSASNTRICDFKLIVRDHRVTTTRSSELAFARDGYSRSVM
jgi:hypothetical protein